VWKVTRRKCTRELSRERRLDGTLFGFFHTGGTLKTKKDLTALEQTVDREPWMDEIPREEWTELQVRFLSRRSNGGSVFFSSRSGDSVFIRALLCVDCIDERGLK